MENNAGGFIHPAIPSPPASSVTSPSLTASALPHPRAQPLKAGSAKETSFIQYVDRGILDVTRRYAKKFSGEESESGGVRGYERFGEVAGDVDRLVDLVWVSGTPSLQTPYLLSLALLLTSYLPSFPPAPKPMFRSLHKLDFAFSSLLQGRNVDSGESLPGFESGRAVTMTEKVRIKSLVERTRVLVVDLMRNADEMEEEVEENTTGDDEDDDEDDDEGVSTGVRDEVDMDEADKWNMEIARVYDRTVVELGDTLGGNG
ncbi:MAG: hypothetical protein M1837_000561 [Sclerophora amabilis]|nr:MAG: hypothetical protein M1837_000561 [Sclerophora amabilis]